MLTLAQDWGYTRKAWLVLSAVALYQALGINKGIYSPLGFYGLMIAYLSLILALFGPQFQIIENLGSRAVPTVIGAGLVLQFAEAIRRFALFYPGTSFAHVFFLAGIALCAGLTLAAAMDRRFLGEYWFVAVVALHFLVGIAFLKIAPVPVIDTITVQQGGIAALLSGHNPFTLTFPNIYGDRWRYFYGDLPVFNGRVHVGFPYPPLSLLMCLPGYLLTGDVRFSHLAATSLSGLLIGRTGRGLVSRLAAVLFLFSPAILPVVQNAWTEAFVVLAFSVVLFRSRLGGFPAVSLGLLVAMKQYVFVAVIVSAWFLIRDGRIRTYVTQMVRVAAVSIAVTLPLALWDLQAFLWSVLLAHRKVGFRPDSLSIPAWLVSLGFPPPPAGPAFILFAIASWFLLRRLPRRPASFAASLSLLLLVIFTFGKQAFVNYYFFAGACLCGAIAVMDRSQNDDWSNDPETTV